MTAREEFNVTAAHITRTPGVCGGEPCIAGRRIKARYVYVWYDLMGMTADEIAQQYHLSLAQVHAALAYCYEHLNEIRQAMEAEDKFVEEFKQNYPHLLVNWLDDDE